MENDRRGDSSADLDSSTRDFSNPHECQATFFHPQYGHPERIDDACEDDEVEEDGEEVEQLAGRRCADEDGEEGRSLVACRCAGEGARVEEEGKEGDEEEDGRGVGPEGGGMSCLSRAWGDEGSSRLFAW